MTMKNLIDCIDLNIPALTTIDKVHAENHKGCLFSVAVIDTIANGETKYIHMKTPPDKQIHIISSTLMSDKLCYIYYAHSPIITPGTGTDILDQIYSNNHHLNKPSSFVELNAGATITNDGTIFYKDIISASRSGASITNPIVGWELKRDSYYMGKIENQEVVAGYLGFIMYWIEHDILEE